MTEIDAEFNYGPPRGMRDFYPQDMALRNAIFHAWASAAHRYGFVQYDACVVESLDLLKRKGGEEIVEQIYTFADKSGRNLALRAEMTPTLARMIVARQGQLQFPLKWFAIAQCFRYERMSRGRKREHYQWNMDVVGENAITAEAEVVAAAVHAIALLGLAAGDFRVHVNSRALLSDLFSRLGIPGQHHAATFLALDKRGKVEESAIGDLLKEAGLDAQGIASAFRVMGIASLSDALAILGEETPAYAALLSFFSLMRAYGIEDAVEFDVSVIRGLGYYTGIVFEAFDTERKFRAIFGGGRYDNLLGDIGGKPASAVGLGFGDVVIAELLADKGKTPASSQQDVIAVGYMEQAQQAAALAIAQAFRKTGKNAELGLHAEKAKAFFGRADKSGFGQAIYIGPDDIQAGAIRIKSLADRSESAMSIASILGRAL